LEFGTSLFFSFLFFSFWLALAYIAKKLYIKNLSAKIKWLFEIFNNHNLKYIFKKIFHISLYMLQVGSQKFKNYVLKILLSYLACSQNMTKTFLWIIANLATQQN
jgi:hypothetical protein